MKRRHHSLLLWRDAFACLLLAGMCLAFGPARAEDKKPPRNDCPAIYGRWSVTHVMDKYGNPQQVAKDMRWAGMLAEAHIDKKNAVLTWHGGKKKASYARTYKFEQTEYRFNGNSSGRNNVIAFIIQLPEEGYPNDKCYLELGEYSGFGVEDIRHNVLLEKLE